MFAGKKSAQIREILISESAWEEMTCLFAPSLGELVDFCSDGTLPQDEIFWIKNETDYRSIVIVKR